MSFTKRAAAALLLSAAAIAGPAVVALPASAATVTPAAVRPAAGAVQCDANLCIQRTSENGVLPATVKAWANSKSFTGHFELIFPSDAVHNSPTESWKAGGAGYSFTGLGGGPGYEIVEWNGSSQDGLVGFAV